MFTAYFPTMQGFMRFVACQCKKLEDLNNCLENNLENKLHYSLRCHKICDTFYPFQKLANVNGIFQDTIMMK